MLDEDAPVATDLLRLARSLDHEPRQLAALIEGMLGVRELWLPKLMRASAGPTLRAEIDSFSARRWKRSSIGLGCDIGDRLAAAVLGLPRGSGGRRTGEPSDHARGRMDSPPRDSGSTATSVRARGSSC